MSDSVRAGDRVRIPAVFVANRPLRTPPSRWLRSIVVARGLDVADAQIASGVSAGDLVVTADIPLAGSTPRHFFARAES